MGRDRPLARLRRRKRRGELRQKEGRPGRCYRAANDLVGLSLGLFAFAGK